ncbi:MAG: YajG family lipoprotein [Ectothiorhodospiraceae bacterium]
MYRRGLLRIAMLVMVAALAGCAQTSQELRLAPRAELGDSAVGDNVTVAVTVEDPRSDPGLGQLSNGSADPVPLTSATPPRYLVRAAVEKALTSSGFTIADSGDAAARLTVIIDSIDHRVSAGVPRDITTNVALTARAQRDGRELGNEASVRRTDTSVLRPDAEANARYLDAAIGRALERLLNDETLALLAGDA